MGETESFRILEGVETMLISMEQVGIRLQFAPSPDHGPDQVQFVLPASKLSALVTDLQKLQTLSQQIDAAGDAHYPSEHSLKFPV